jgi:hypothetical protein
VLARRWGGSNGNELYPHLSGEGDAQYSSRMTGLALASLRADPSRILGSALNHFLNNEICNLLVFPLRDQLDSLADLMLPTRAFWQSWNGKPQTGQIPTLGIYLLLFGFGLGAAVQKNGLAGLLPLGLSMIYNAWTALFLSSGDRFLVPVDWAVYLYLFLGLITLISLIFRFKSGYPVFSPAVESVKDKVLNGTWIKATLIAIFIVFCGASIGLTEAVFPRIYKQVNPAELSRTQVITLHGRAIYPRWYYAGEGEPGSAKMGYGEADQARLVFFMSGEINTLVILPIAQAPGFFPNTSDVVVSGKLQEGYLRASAITVNKDGISAIYQP